MPVKVSRRIGATAAAIFGVLADPGRHVVLDGSGMVRGAVTATPICGVGDVFVMKMFFAELGDYEMNNHVVEYELDRRIGWEPEAGQGRRGDGRSRSHGQDAGTAGRGLHQDAGRGRSGMSTVAGIKTIFHPNGQWFILLGQVSCANLVTFCTRSRMFQTPLTALSIKVCPQDVTNSYTAFSGLSW
jgi:hypothetical protein